MAINTSSKWDPMSILNMALLSSMLTLAYMALLTGPQGTTYIRIPDCGLILTWTPQCTSIKGLVVSIRWYLGSLKG